MWLGGLKFEVHTFDIDHAGTNSPVQMIILRDGDILTAFPLDYPPDIVVSSGSDLIFNLEGPEWLPRMADETPIFPPNFVANPMPYPTYGLEFSHGLNHHLHFRLRIAGGNLWQWSAIHVSYKRLRLVEVFQGFPTWKRDAHWTGLGEYNGTQFPMSTDQDEGYSVLELGVPPPPFD